MRAVGFRGGINAALPGDAGHVQTELSILKACADETRLRTLYLLARRELCVCELVRVLRMPQGKVSRHLAVLKNAGLVTDRREGTWIHYSLTPAAHPLSRLLHDYLAVPHSEAVLTDGARLEQMCCSGGVCGPAPESAAGQRQT